TSPRCVPAPRRWPPRPHCTPSCSSTEPRRGARHAGPGPTPVPATPHHPLRSAMTAQTLDGKATAKTIKQELAERVSRLLEAGHERPGLATVLVGDDPGSAAYVRGKHRDSERVGLTSIQKHLPADAAQADVEALVDELNQDPACSGYCAQLLLSVQIDTDAILERIDPAKDADGLQPMNPGRLVFNGDTLSLPPLPCTQRAVIELVERHVLDFRCKD